MLFRSGPKSYVVVLNDGRVWKRHVDHLRRSNLMTDGPEILLDNSRVQMPQSDIESTLQMRDRPTPETQTREEKAQVSAEPRAETRKTVPTHEQEAVTSTTVPKIPKQVAVRRSTRKRNPPLRLVEGKG